MGAASAARAQVSPEPRAVDQGVADVDPLRTSLRIPPGQGLRKPTGWDEVYAVRYRDASGREREGFARASGGLVAVFPWSVYVPGPGGAIVDVPPGTVFRHGALDEPPAEPTGAAGPPPRAGPDLRPDVATLPRPETARVPLEARGLFTQPPGAGAIGSPPGIWTDDTYRRRRMSALLARAAAADAGE